MNYIKLSCINLIFAFIGLANSSEKNSSTIELIQKNKSVFDKTNSQDEIVVTGTKSKRALSDAPIKTEQVLSEEILANHFSNVSEALSILPGVSLSRMEARSGSSAIIQGFGESHVLVLIDGSPVSTSSFSGVDLNQIDTFDIEKVEVVKGAASSLYGSSAIGGVINIITKKRSKKQLLQGSLKSGAFSNNEAKYDNFTPLDSKLAFQDFNDFLIYKISIHKNSRSAYDLNSNSIYQDGASSDDLGLKLNLDKKINSKFNFESEFQIKENKSNSVVSKYTPMRKFERRDNGSLTNINKISLGLTKNNSSLSDFKLKLIQENINDELNLEDDIKTSYKESVQSTGMSTSRLEVDYGAALNNSHYFSSGLVFQKQTLNQFTTSSFSNSSSNKIIEVDNKGHETFEFYVQDSWFLGNLELIPGLRLQEDSGFGSHYSPKISALYKQKYFQNYNTNYRASVGNGYRVPGLKEKFFNLDHRAFGNYTVSGNEDLKPESSLSYQLGIELYKNKNNQFYSNVFYNEIKNLIETKQSISKDGLIEFQYENIEKVKTNGIELGQTSSINHFTNFFQNYNFTNTINEKTNRQLPSRPKATYKLGVNFLPNEKLDIRANYRFESDQFTNEKNTNISESFNIIDLKFNYKITQTSTGLFGIDNVFNLTRNAAKDTLEPEIDMRPIYGRYIYIGYEFRGL